MNDQDDVHPWKIAWVILGWCSRSHWRNALKTTLRNWKARDFGAIFPSHFGLEHLGVYIGIPGGFPKIHPQMIQVIFPGWWFGTWIWFSMIYIYGLSSFPLTNSCFSRWLLHHQPDFNWVLKPMVTCGALEDEEHRQTRRLQRFRSDAVMWGGWR